jgi:NAD(P)-dependent dehydrogenase (short-subunit alcohol dehydrogenase family)
MKTKYIIITGAGGFVGSYFASHLLKKNYNLILIDNNKKSLNNLKKKLTLNSYLKPFYFVEDISKEKNVKKIFKFLKKKKTNITGLINLAAVDAKPKKNTSKYITAEQLTLELEAGLVSAYIMTKYFGEDMFKKGFGRIVNIGSDLSIISPDQRIYSGSYINYVKPASYSMIKFGLVGLTKYFATFFAAGGVTCNTLSPGAISHKQSKSLLKNLISKTPMRRLAKRDDLISTLLYMLDENSSFVSGQNIIIDGGRTLI